MVVHLRSTVSFSSGSTYGVWGLGNVLNYDKVCKAKLLLGGIHSRHGGLEVYRNLYTYCIHLVLSSLHALERFLPPSLRHLCKGVDQRKAYIYYTTLNWLKNNILMPKSPSPTTPPYKIRTKTLTGVEALPCPDNNFEKSANNRYNIFSMANSRGAGDYA